MNSSGPAYHVHDDDLPPEALDDCFKPPKQPVIVGYLHCGREYDSWQIVWVPNEEKDDGSDEHRLPGMWCCPTEGCGGAGFKFDILPVDPDYVDEETGERCWHCDPPMIEGHECDCECAECEMLRDEEEAEFEREAMEYEKKLASGEIPRPVAREGEDEIPF